MAIKKIEGYEVPSYGTLAEAVEQQLRNPDFALALAAVNQAIQLLTEAIGTTHEAVPELAMHHMHRVVHQRAGSAIASHLTVTYKEAPPSRAKLLRLIEAGNPWFNAELFKKIDARLDKAAATLVHERAKGPAMAEARKVPDLTGLADRVQDLLSDDVLDKLDDQTFNAAPADQRKLFERVVYEYLRAERPDLLAKLGYA